MATFIHGIPHLSPEDQQVLQDVLRNELKNLVFRRVGKVIAPWKGFKKALEYEFDASRSEARTKIHKDPKKIPKNTEILRKNWELCFENFYGFAEPAGRGGIRDTDPTPEEEIYFCATGYAELDIVDGCTFKFQRLSRHRVRPMAGDLICGLVEKTDRKPKFTHWFNCSEQFLRAWTLLMFKHHESYKGKSESRLKDLALSGNRLNTNSFLKWVLTLKHNQQPVPQKDADQRYYYLRTEQASVKWIHVYSALVLMARWGELPCRYNIPINPRHCFKMNHWTLPKHFVTNILQKWTHATPGDWNCQTWSDLERSIWKSRAVYQTPKEVFQVEKTEFPPLLVSKTSWVVHKICEEPPQKEPDLLTPLSEAPRVMSWADMVEEEDESLQTGSLTDSQGDVSTSEPSEGGSRQIVYVLYYSQKKGQPRLMEIVDSTEKAKKYLIDWVNTQTENGHFGDGKQRQHDQGEASNCELCKLRKYKAIHSEAFDVWYKVELWDGTVGYAEEKEVL